MTKWIIRLAACLAVCFAANRLFAADDAPKDDNARPANAEEMVSGRVKDIDLKVCKIAVETWGDPTKPPEIKIFLLNAKTTVRKAEKPLTVVDIRKGNIVLVVYKPGAKEGDLPTATVISIDEGFGRGFPGGPGRGPGRHH